MRILREDIVHEVSGVLGSRGTRLPLRSDSNAVRLYFALTFGISWIAAAAVALPDALHHRPSSQTAGLMMFPAMLCGPLFAGLFMIYRCDGSFGLSRLWSGLNPANLGWWYCILLTPPCLILLVLGLLKTFVSSNYTPHFFPLGFLFGVPAGFAEEIGWTGFALPRLLRDRSLIKASILLGVLWALWHLPVIDHLGAASPHFGFRVLFVAAFSSVMIPVRILICWIYDRTQSVLLCQLLHVFSTGSLVMFGPIRVSPGEETLWYALYGATLWLILALYSVTTSRRNTQLNRLEPGTASR